MNDKFLTSLVPYREHIYWLAVVILVAGILSSQLAPPNIDYVALAGILLASMVVRPMIAFK